MNKKLILTLLLLVTICTLFAQEDVTKKEERDGKLIPLVPLIPATEIKSPSKAKKAKGNEHPATFETDLTLMAVYPWGFVIEAGETVDVPVLRFSHPLTHSNSLKFRGGLKLTPITFESDFKATFTPIAFLQFFMGAGIGTGWSFSRFHGFAKNIDDGTGISKKIPINGKDFFFNTRFGATFQFDLGVATNNKWAHVVFLMDQGFKYFGAGNMTSKDSWVYAEDYGESRNSWLYVAKYVIGYRMPTVLSFIGMQIETEKKLYTDPPNKENWADDYTYAYITPIIAFTATDYLNVVITPQFFTRKNYVKSVDTFYENNYVDAKKPQYLEFYRVAVFLSFTFKH